MPTVDTVGVIGLKCVTGVIGMTFDSEAGSIGRIPPFDITCNTNYIK